MTELEFAIRYDVEHDLFHPQNVFSDEYITPTFVAYVKKVEKENAELKDYNKKLLQSDIDKQNKIVLLSQKVNDLQKENAELKRNKKTIAHLSDEIEKIQNEKIAKAKKLLKKVVTDFHNMDCVTVHIDKTIAEAEKFLKGCDIDNAIQQANKGLDFDKIADEMKQDLKDGEVAT